ncbi:MarR family winged helix-turn-helix transcriptional regulator [Frondihabitans australicus]|uniref:DNA-binding MarR family transcriptional regulator n=1 Tax=Frondihabitans australicus TaxID=386892 RepID=A0A495IHC2_9MICO|nr:MarR family transcriptional regulator [Frondihabitans australicus]RKR75402.1 DNA-binding MarR family transcriptional regulator [Frondihabitans australicus]
MATKWEDPSAARAFFDDLLIAEIRLYNALEARLREGEAASVAQLGFLRYVRDHEGARVADIAAWLALGVGATSKGVDRLEKLGWLERRPNPEDRRSSLLALTDEGAAALARAEPVADEALAGLLRPVDDEADLGAAADALTALRVSLEARGLGLPTG